MQRRLVVRVVHVPPPGSTGERMSRPRLLAPVSVSRAGVRFGAASGTICESSIHIRKQADMSELLERGAARATWIRSRMPLLADTRRDFAERRPFEGRRIGMSLHVEPKTAVLLEVLAAGGAEIVATGNHGSTQDDIVAYLRSHRHDRVRRPRRHARAARRERGRRRGRPARHPARQRRRPGGGRRRARSGRLRDRRHRGDDQRRHPPARRARGPRAVPDHRHQRQPAQGDRREPARRRASRWSRASCASPT